MKSTGIPARDDHSGSAVGAADEPRRTGWPHSPLTPLVTLAASVPVALVNELFTHGESALVATVVRFVGIVMLCTSGWWAGTHKAIGTLIAFVLPAVIAVTASHAADIGAATLIVVNVLLTTLPLVACRWLWRVRRRPADATR
ncbi:hypothetical protein [Streptomyces odontomachi]|uniref:hypothetical protein n=1 Tax=Streptomyces odontomachi TaxID=2944940 RepID=UPI00210BD052|nr:hypothetical protein [Streptomyces sp. ODS25]